VVQQKHIDHDPRRNARALPVAILFIGQSVGE
jgi:hypothetical protein